MAVVAVACGGDGGNDEANAAQEAALSTIGVTAETGPEAGYLTAVGEAIDLFGARSRDSMRIAEDLGGGEAGNQVGSLAAGAGTAFVETLAALEALDPPPGYERDHAVLIQVHEELVEADGAFGEALGASESGAEAIAELGAAKSRGLVLLSYNTCTLVRDRYDDVLLGGGKCTPPISNLSLDGLVAALSGMAFVCGEAEEASDGLCRECVSGDLTVSVVGSVTEVKNVTAASREMQDPGVRRLVLDFVGVVEAETSEDRLVGWAEEHYESGGDATIGGIRLRLVPGVIGSIRLQGASG